MSNDDEGVRSFTPSDLARRLARAGTIMNMVTAWAFLRGHVAEDFPGRADPAHPGALLLTESEFAGLVDELLLHVDSFRSKLSGSIIEAERKNGENGEQS